MKEQELLEASFPGRPWERELYTPLVGSSMLEFGNKVKGTMVYKDVFEGLGFRHVSVDLNGKNGAMALDLAKPFNLGTFDMVTNLGTSEHVSEDNYDGQIQCWRNIVGAMHKNSVLVSSTPKPHAPGCERHGRWYPEKEFYLELARLNGMDVERLYVGSGANANQRNLIYARLVRREVVPFVMPKKGMYRNPAQLPPQVEL